MQTPIDLDWHQAERPMERARAGVSARSRASLESHAVWQVRDERRDVIALLEEQSRTRVPELVPLRYYRMSDSAFTFYRGTALIMANDLARTPVSGIPVQACGDAHIGNFGMFRSPGDRLVFDINDFDETSTGPWEWDVKRLAVSVEICGRANGIAPKDRRAAVERCVHSYRDHIRQFSQMDFLDVWYDHLDVEAALDHYESTVNGKRNRTLRDAAMRAAARDSDAAAAKLTYVDGRHLRFHSKPPALVPISELDDYADLHALEARLETLFDSYRHSLYEDRRYVLDRYQYHDTARKVVGVGSVGTRAWVSILTGRGLDDPLMLQMKEAQESVLERFCGRSPYATHGERVVQGQKLIQSTADVLLGWASFTAEDGRKRDYYVRQFWNGKGSIDLDHLNALGLSDLGRMCAWCLAHAHARTGDSIAIANYLGGTDEFDQAIASFAVSYAEQNEADYALFKRLIKAGELPCSKR
ncbi:DUF2252 domain-containing protein [Bifidobacterium jacchi]|uniref:DUF2252 domain-containing protein n=1 Tax=Bifidobacterium jacchi TaxID=2490545 RepID=UPI0015881A57|nr:DUF2252 domain-containing protein [Bifidobacterium jacchi]